MTRRQKVSYSSGSLFLAGILLVGALVGMRRPAANDLPATVERMAIIFQESPQECSQDPIIATDIKSGEFLRTFNDLGKWNIVAPFGKKGDFFVTYRDWKVEAGKKGFSQANGYMGSRVHFGILDLPTGSVKELFPDADNRHFEIFALDFNPEKGAWVEVFGVDGTSYIAYFSWDGKMGGVFPNSGDGKHYCPSWNKDGTRLIYHVAGPPDPEHPMGYNVRAFYPESNREEMVWGEKDKNVFCPTLRPGDDDCFLATVSSQELGNDSEETGIWVTSIKNGSRRLVSKRQWGSGRYGIPGSVSYGSNLPSWTSDGSILATLTDPPGSHSAWVTKRTKDGKLDETDDDHFYSRYDPSAGHGGTKIAKLKIEGKRITEEVLVKAEDGVWLSHASETANGDLAYCKWSTKDPSRKYTVIRRKGKVVFEKANLQRFGIMKIPMLTLKF